MFRDLLHLYMIEPETELLMNSYSCKKLFHHLSLSATLFAIPLLPRAEVPQQTWKTVQQQLKKNEGIIAHQITSRFELPGDDGPEFGQYSARFYQLDKDGKPLREFQGDKNAYKFDPMSLSLATLVANRPEEFLLPPSAITFIGDDTVDGEAALVYEVKSSVGKGIYPISANVWITQKEGIPLKIDGTIEKLPLPGVKKAAFVLQYGINENGLSLPTSLQVKYTISIFFHKGNVAFQQDFSDWRRKP